MEAKNIRRYLFLMANFRNGLELIMAHRSRRPVGRAITWGGAEIRHPPHRVGLVGTLLELWLDKVYTKGFYEPQDGDVVLDAGAHIGLFALWVAKKKAGARVVAIEPFLENFECLEANVRSFGLSNVEVHFLALGGKMGKGSIRAVGDRSIDHLLVPGEAEGDRLVEVVTLEGLLRLAKVEQVALLKCDIEGSEYDVFENVSEETLLRFERIALEYHDNLRPGTLGLLKAKLSKTHHIEVRPEPGQAHGILRAWRKVF